jgi:hypothetical protein
LGVSRKIIPSIADYGGVDMEDAEVDADKGGGEISLDQFSYLLCSSLFYWSTIHTKPLITCSMSFAYFKFLGKSKRTHPSTRIDLTSSNSFLSCSSLLTPFFSAFYGAFLAAFASYCFSYYC